MAFGPGKYDELVTIVREEMKAEGVLLLVVNGALGSGFSAQLPPALTLTLPTILREIATQIETHGPEA